MVKKWAKRIALALLILFIAIQFFRIDKENPQVNPNQDLLSTHSGDQTVKDLIKAACYDCHSFETKYPWYTNIAPISWWIAGHIDHGREELNFSIWSTYSDRRKDHKLDECVELIEEGSMPLASYLPAHPEARLTETQKNELIDWFKNQRRELNYQHESE